MILKILLFLFLFFGFSYSNIIITEVESNPFGTSIACPGDKYHEYIELYNNSNDTIDLTNYRLMIESSYDSIIMWDTLFNDSIIFWKNKIISNTIFLLPKSFALIVDKEIFACSKAPTFTLDSLTLLLTINHSGFSGSYGLSQTKSIILLNSNNQIISTFGTPNVLDTFPNSIPDSLSWNRLNIDSVDSKSNWELSLNTPGKFHIPYKYYAENLKITEINANDLEWIEIINLGPDSINLKDWKIGSYSTHYKISNTNFFLDSGEYCIIAKDTSILSCSCKKVKAISWISLPLSSGHIEIISPHNIIVDSVSYNSNCFDIPKGFSIELKDFYFLANNCSSWIPLEFPSPCKKFPYLDFFEYGDTSKIVINEVFFNPLIGQTEWIELYNPSNDTVLVYNWKLGDDDVFAAKLFARTPKIFLPGEYLLVIKDAPSFAYLPDLLSTYFIPQGWESLSNTEDIIAIYNSSNVMIDSFYYNADFYEDTKGKSLERISSSAKSGASNFKISLNLSGSTPGYENSLSKIIGTETTFSILNRRVDPSRDSELSKIRIAIENYSGKKVECRVFDLKGRLQRTLGYNTILEWDGKGESQSNLKPGIYIITVYYDNVLKLKEAVVLLWGNK